MEQKLFELTSQLSLRDEEISKLKQETENMLNQSVEKEKEQQEQVCSIPLIIYLLWNSRRNLLLQLC